MTTTYQRHFDEDVLQSETNTCPECTGRVTTNILETVCDDCGLVFEDRPLDRGPEWYTGATDDSDTSDERRRVGNPLTEARHDRGLTTEIGWNRDGKGNALSTGEAKRTARLRREHARTVRRRTREHNLMLGFYEVRRITAGLGLGSGLRDEACRLFRRASEADLLTGRSIEALASGAVYGVCRRHDRPWTPDDIARFAQCDAEAVRLGYRVLNVELGVDAVPPSVVGVVTRYGADLGLSRPIQNRAVELARLAETAGLANGASPSGLAAACLYAASRDTEERLAQAVIADAVGTTPVTLRKHWRTLQVQPESEGLS